MDQNNRNTKIKEAIVKTIAFFDLFDFPLTVLEIWSNLWCEKIDIKDINLNEIIQILENGIKNIDHKNGFYFVTGREDIIQIRLKRYNYAVRKLKRALTIFKFFSFLPGIKLIAIGNFIGAYNKKNESDIDFFIVTSRKLVWTTRFFITGLAKIFKIRPRPGNTRDKMCLSFFVDEDNLDLSSMKIHENDIYFYYWFLNLLFINKDELKQKNFLEKNQWIKERIPYCIFQKLPDCFMIKLFNFNKFDLICRIFEEILKKIQLKLFPLEIKNLMNKNKKVIINEKIIKLHVNDKREEFYNNWRMIVDKLNDD